VSQYSQLLRRNPDYARLWFAQVVSLTGDWFNVIALNTLVSRYTDGSGLAISLLLLARFVPPLVVGPFAGVLVDRFDRKQLLIWSNVLRAVVVLMFLFATTPGTVWLIYTLTVIQFMLSAVFEPGQSAITPSLIHRDDLVTANTLASVTWSVMLALGAVVGGVVSAIFGPAVALVVDAMTFAVAAWLIVPIKLNPPLPSVELKAETKEESGSLIEGLRYVVAHPATAAVLLVKGGNSVGNVDTLATVIATQIFVLGADGQLSLGIIYSVFGLGAILGPLLVNRFHDGSVKQLRRLIIVGFIFSTLGWLFLGSASVFIVALIGMGIRAMGGSMNWTYSSVIIQKTVPDRYLGRVFSLDFAVFQLVTVASTIVHGALVDALGAEKVPMIALWTAIASVAPLLLWTSILPRMEGRERRREAELTPAD